VGILLAGAASFSIGSWFGNRPLIYRSQTDPHPLQTETVQGNPQARHVLLVLAVLATLLFLINVIRLAGGIFNITPLFLLELNSSDSPLERAGTITNLVIGSGGLLPVLALWVMIME